MSSLIQGSDSAGANGAAQNGATVPADAFAANGSAKLRVAIAHDYLNQFGGAERVVAEMTRIWPDAPVYTSLYRPASTLPEFNACDVRTSWLDRLPVDRRFRLLFPLYPHAIGRMNVKDADVVVASSSGWAHGMRTAPETTRVVYCHAPPRWLDPSMEYFGTALRNRTLLRHGLAPFRQWDRRAAWKADCYLVNSHNVRQRVLDVYGLESHVVHPPVDVDRFTPKPRGDRLLVVSRLLPYKRVDLVIEATKELGLPLDIVGVGPDEERLRALADDSVTFHGQLDDQGVTDLMSTCNALCFPGREDFGITAVEANAAGKPVVAFAAGGSLETQTEGVTAALFAEQTVADVVEAIQRVERLDTPPEVIAESARRFAPEQFARRLVEAVAAAREAHLQRLAE